MTDKKDKKKDKDDDDKDKKKSVKDEADAYQPDPKITREKLRPKPVHNPPS